MSWRKAVFRFSDFCFEAAHIIFARNLVTRRLTTKVLNISVLVNIEPSREREVREAGRERARERVKVTVPHIR
jgi:hypothetical protein